MAAELRAVKADGTYSEILPDWSDLTFSQDLVAAGSLTFSYPTTGGRHSELLTHGQQFAVLLDGVEPRNGRFTYDEGTGSRIAEADGQTSTYSCKSNLARLSTLMIAPAFLSTTYADTDSYLVYVNRTVGYLVATAVNNAMARGSQLSAAPAPWLTHPLTGFTTTADSDGASWIDTYDVTFSPGPVSEVLDWVVTNGFAEPAMDKKILRLYRPENNGTNLAAQNKPVVLQTGRDFTEASYQTSSADLVNSLLVIGDSNSCAWVKNQTSIDTYGYRESTLSVTGASQQATLIAAGNAYLSTRSIPRWAYTYSVNALYLESAYGVPRPFIDYQVGDSILILDGAETAVRRIRLLSATWPNSRAASVQLSVNDWFSEREIEVDRRLKRLGG